MNNSKVKDTHDQALQQLKELDEMLYCDVDLIESMSKEEADAELCAMGLDSNKSLPPPQSPRKPAAKSSPIRILFLSANPWTGKRIRESFSTLFAASLTGPDGNRVIEAYKDSTRLWYRSEQPRHLTLSCVTPGGRIVGSGEPQAVESIPSIVLSRIVEEKRAEVSLRLKTLRDLENACATDLKHLRGEFTSHCDRSPQKRRVLTDVMLSGLVFTASMAIPLVALGDGQSPIHRPFQWARYAVMSGFVHLSLIMIIGRLLSGVGEQNPTTRIKKLHRAIRGTASLVGGLAAALAAGLWIKAGTGIVTTLVSAMDFGLVLLASELVASLTLRLWPTALSKRISSVAKRHNDTKRKIAIAETELQTLTKCHDWLIRERRQQLDPAMFTNPN